MPNKAIFLDLDSTLIQTRTGSKFPKNIYDWKFTSGIIKILKKFAKEGYYIIIVSNQGGIASGFLTREDFEDKVNDITFRLIKSLNTVNIYSYYCDEMESFYRKPNPGMAYMAALEHSIDLSKSIMVGDASGLSHSFSDSDLKFAKKAGFSRYYDIQEFLSEDLFIIDGEDIAA